MSTPIIRMTYVERAGRNEERWANLNDSNFIINK